MILRSNYLVTDENLSGVLLGVEVYYIYPSATSTRDSIQGAKLPKRHLPFEK